MNISLVSSSLIECTLGFFKFAVFAIREKYSFEGLQKIRMGRHRRFCNSVARTYLSMPCGDLKSVLLAELVLDQLWQFNTTTRQWSKIKAQASPTKRLWNGFAALEGNIFVFGGMVFPGERHAHDNHHSCNYSVFTK